MQSTARFGGEDECYLMLNKQVLGLRRWNKQDFRSKIFLPTQNTEGDGPDLRSSEINTATTGLVGVGLWMEYNWIILGREEPNNYGPAIGASGEPFINSNTEGDDQSSFSHVYSALLFNLITLTG